MSYLPLSISKELLNTISAIVTAASTLAIPILIFVLSQQAQEKALQREVDTRTLQAIRDLNDKIAQAVTKKRELDRQNQKKGADAFDFKYINENEEVQGVVFSILNEYEYLCTGANQKLLSNSIINVLRKDSLHKTWSDYEAYIVQHRKKSEATRRAWIQCEEWTRANRS